MMLFGRWCQMFVSLKDRLVEVADIPASTPRFSLTTVTSLTDLSGLLHHCNTRYDWLVRPCSAGTFTLQETPSFAWRTNGWRYRQVRELVDKTTRRRICLLGPLSRKCGRMPALVRCTTSRSQKSDHFPERTLRVLRTRCWAHPQETRLKTRNNIARSNIYYFRRGDSDFDGFDNCWRYITLPFERQKQVGICVPKECTGLVQTP